MLFQIRQLEKEDYNKKYLLLLKQLSIIDENKITKNDFDLFVNNLNENNQIYVIEKNNQIIGSITLIIENKIIHNFGKVCHIEDVVIDKNTRGLGLGRKLLDFAKEYSKKNNCYKIILNCSEKNIRFYEKCGFEKKEVEMVMYI